MYLKYTVNCIVLSLYIDTLSSNIRVICNSQVLSKLHVGVSHEGLGKQPAGASPASFSLSTFTLLVASFRPASVDVWYDYIRVRMCRSLFATLFAHGAKAAPQTSSPLTEWGGVARPSQTSNAFFQVFAATMSWSAPSLCPRPCSSFTFALRLILYCRCQMLLVPHTSSSYVSIDHFLPKFAHSVWWRAAVNIRIFFETSNTRHE